VGPLIAALLLAMSCAGGMRDRGLQPAMASKSLLEEELEPRRFAVLIGVDRYDDPAFFPLHHSGDDAKSMADVLQRGEGGGFDSVVVLTGDDTGREAVSRALRTLKADVRKEDTVVVYFSGHGTQVDDPAKRYLLVKDSRAGQLGDTAFELGALQSWFSTLPAVRKALILDACFTGEGKAVVRPDLPPPSTPPGSMTPRASDMGGGEMHLFATSPGRPAKEDDKLGHGVYTYYLLESLGWGFAEADRNHDKVVTAYEAHDYARSRTMAYTDSEQVPELALRVVGEGDLVLAGDPKARDRKEQALLYLYGNRGALASASVKIDGRDRGVLPGAIPVEPGRRHVTLQDDAGNVLVDGVVDLRAQPYRIEELSRMMTGPERSLSVEVGGFKSQPLESVFGDGGPSLSLGWVRRGRSGLTRPLFGELDAGLGIAPGREVGETFVTAVRPLVTAGAAGGVQLERGKLSVDLGLAATVVLAPPSYLQQWGGHPVPADVPSEAGWWLSAVGPMARVGWQASDRLSVGVVARVEGAMVDVNGDGQAELIPWLTLGTAFEWRLP
jgi:hypothetical protein